MSTVEGLKKLLEEINNGMGKLIAEMEEKGIKESTFDANSPDEYEKLEPLTWIGREIIAAQLQDLASLIIGPKNFINAFSTNVGGSFLADLLCAVILSPELLWLLRHWPMGGRMLGKQGF
jgi:hypothetical protein